MIKKISRAHRPTKKTHPQETPMESKAVNLQNQEVWSGPKFYICSQIASRTSHMLKLSLKSPSLSPLIPSFRGIHKLRKFY